MNENQVRNLASLYSLDGDDQEDNSLDEQYFYESLQQGGRRYEDERFIAKGGEKTITRVFDTQTGRDVAMAKLHEGSTRERYESFLREARLTALLDHPNIVSIFDIALDECEQPYFAMELKTGDGFDEVIEKYKKKNASDVSTAELNQLLSVFLKVCDAIAYAHSKGVIHLDIKPANIQIGDFGEVVVCDWGLGKVIGSEDKEYDTDAYNADLLNNMTLTGIVKGTPGYMAPEQIMQDAEKTVQTDIYSLGCLLYSVLTFLRPLNGDTEIMLHNTVKGLVSSPSKRCPEKNIPDSLNAVVMKAISLEPEDRYETVDQLRAEVQSYLDGFATNAEKASIFKGLQLLYKRNRVVCNVSLLFALVTVSLVALFILRLNEETDKAVAERQKAINEKNRAEATLVKYENEKRQVTAFNIQKELSPHNYQRALKGFYKDPVKVIWNHIKSLEKRGWFVRTESFYLIAQDFKGALNSLEQSSRTSGKEKQVAVYRKYQAFPRDAEGLLELNELVSLIGELVSTKEIIERIVYHDAFLRKDFEGYEAVILALLQKWNGQLVDGSFSYNTKRGLLRLKGEGVKVLGGEVMWPGRKSLLHPLPVKVLDIRHTQVFDLRQLRGLDELEEIDIRHTLVTDLAPLNELGSLKKVIISEKQFPQEVLEPLDQSIAVEVR